MTLGLTHWMATLAALSLFLSIKGKKKITCPLCGISFWLRSQFGGLLNNIVKKAVWKDWHLLTPNAHPSFFHPPTKFVSFNYDGGLVIKLYPALLWPHGLYSSWNSPGKNTGVGSLSPLQGIYPTQGSNLVSYIAGRFFTDRATREAFLTLIIFQSALIFCKS